MVATDSQQIIEVILSREELVLILNLLQANTIPGLDPDTLGELSQDQQSLGFIFAERALRARGLAQLQEDGQLVVHNALLTSVGVCAYAQTSVLVHHLPSGDFPTARYFGHIRGGTIVAHTMPAEALHRLSILPDQITLVEHIMTVCDCENLVQTAAAPVSIAKNILAQARDMAVTEGVQPTSDLLTVHGVNDESSRIIAQTLANKHNVSIIQIIKIQPNDTVYKWELTVLHNDETAWLMTLQPKQTDDAETVCSLQPIVTDELKNLLNTSLASDMPMTNESLDTKDEETSTDAP